MPRLRAFALVLLAVSATAQPKLGETTFENTGLEAAQEPFLRGVLLLHSFEYDDALEAFQDALEVDPGFAMAAWGEAMTHNHPVWQRQNRDAARAVLEGVDMARASEREQAYLRTLGILFGDGDKEARDDLYEDAMRDLAESYPDDLDAQAFYALSILGTAHEGRDFATYMRAAAVAEEVFEANPRHPGAAHYLIHAYDDPVHAPLGLRPARVYANVAPAASHALHMPSHIYLALGMWPEVAEMNERSYLAAKAGTDRRGQALNGHGWHALWWWHYAATQLDDRRTAGRLLQLASIHSAADPGNGTAQAHIVRIASAHASAFGDVSVLEDEALRASALEDASQTTRAIRWLPTVLDWIANGEPGRGGGHDLAAQWISAFASEVDGDDDAPWGRDVRARADARAASHCARRPRGRPPPPPDRGRPRGRGAVDVWPPRAGRAVERGSWARTPRSRGAPSRPRPPFGVPWTGRPTAASPSPASRPLGRLSRCEDTSGMEPET